MTLSCSACTSLQQNVSLVQDAALKVAFCPQQQLPRHGFRSNVTRNCFALQVAQQNAEILMGAGQYFLKHEFKPQPQNVHSPVAAMPGTPAANPASNSAPAPSGVSVTAADAPVILSMKKAPV